MIPGAGRSLFSDHGIRLLKRGREPGGLLFQNPQATFLNALRAASEVPPGPGRGPNQLKSQDRDYCLYEKPFGFAQQ